MNIEDYEYGSGGPALLAGERPPVKNPAPWRGQNSFKSRVAAQFRSRENIDYLREIFKRDLTGGARKFIVSSLEESVHGFYAEAVLDEDMIAQRGGLRPGVALWEEVRRLNRVFYESRMEVAASMSVGYINEPYHMRMFEADSIRPPGLESLNNDGPSYELLENQVPHHSSGPGAAASKRSNQKWVDDMQLSTPTARSFSGFVTGSGGGGGGGSGGGGGNGGSGNSSNGGGNGGNGGNGSGSSGGDEAWSAANPYRSYEEAAQEYRDQYFAGSSDKRFMRRFEIPFWQKGGREGIDHNIRDTLGAAPVELETMFQKWDIIEQQVAPRAITGKSRYYGARKG